MESRGLAAHHGNAPHHRLSAEAVRPALILILKRLDRMSNKIHKMPNGGDSGKSPNQLQVLQALVTSSLSVFKVVDQSRVEGMAQKCSAVGYMCRANQDMNA